MTKEKTTGQKLIDAFRKAGYEIATVTIIETPEDKQRHKDVREFIRELNHLHEIAKNSKLRFGACVQSPT
jgi:hypothetical protein